MGEQRGAARTCALRVRHVGGGDVDEESDMRPVAHLLSLFALLGLLQAARPTFFLSRRHTAWSTHHHNRTMNDRSATSAITRRQTRAPTHPAAMNLGPRAC